MEEQRSHRDGNDVDVDAHWHDLSAGWSGVIDTVARTPDELGRIADVPPGWVAALEAAARGSDVAERWRAIPRFARYLRSALLDVGVGSGIAGPVLVYLLRDWNQLDDEQFEPGLMIGGVPATDPDVEAFEREVGPVPDALRAAWKQHSFLLLKNGLWLSSPRLEESTMVGGPRIAGTPSTGWVGGEHGTYECLEVLDPGSAISGCLVRAPGEASWRDHVVYREMSGHITHSTRPTIESTLTDWDFAEWVEE
jgi:hypothetical protein